MSLIRNCRSENLRALYHELPNSSLARSVWIANGCALAREHKYKKSICNFDLLFKRLTSFKLDTGNSPSFIEPTLDFFTCFWSEKARQTLANGRLAICFISSTRCCQWKNDTIGVLTKQKIKKDVWYYVTKVAYAILKERWFTTVNFFRNRLKFRHFAIQFKDPSEISELKRKESKPASVFMSCFYWEGVVQRLIAITAATQWTGWGQYNALRTCYKNHR